MFNERKAAQMAAYLLHRRGGIISHLKLMKLLYLADREAMDRYGVPVSGDLPVAIILLTDPHPNDRLILLVNISSINPRIHHDGTCPLFVGDQAFIKRDSYVNFAKARIEKTDKLEQGVCKGIFVPKGTIKGDVFARICRGLMESRFTPQKARRFYEEMYPGARG